MANPVFPAFVKNVTDKGYFKGCEEGSSEYQDRMAKVIASFRKKLEAVSVVAYCYTQCCTIICIRLLEVLLIVVIILLETVLCAVMWHAAFCMQLVRMLSHEYVSQCHFVAYSD
jgi:hypothetical protein